MTKTINNSLLLLIILITACKSAKQAAIAPPIKLYEELKDKDNTKMLRGIIAKEQITQDTAFGWYAAGQKFYKPNAAAVDALKAKSDKINIILFGGTWCGDTKNLLPKYFALFDAAQFPAERLTIIAVDRAKTTIGNIQKPFNITNVPTLIVMKDGKEIGRIVEYGKTALVDKELGEMLSVLQ